jgi:hypothetical protein
MQVSEYGEPGTEMGDYLCLTLLDGSKFVVKDLNGTLEVMLTNGPNDRHSDGLLVIPRVSNVIHLRAGR